MEVLLQGFEDYLTSEDKAKSTIGHALTYTRRFIYENNITDLAQVTVKIIADYFSKLQGSSQAKINMVNWALRRFCRWAGLSDLDFPKQKHTLRKVVNPLTDTEVEAIEYWIYMNTLEPIYIRRHVLRLMFYTGLRVKDIMTLSRADFQFIDESGEEQSILEITKDGLNRKVAISRNFSAELQYYFRGWWEETNAFNVTIGNVNYMCRYLNQYDILGDGRKLYPELFRISYACRSLEQGMGLQELQQLMGYKDIRSVRSYIKLLTKDKIKIPDEGIVADIAKDKQVVKEQREGEQKNEH